MFGFRKKERVIFPISKTVSWLSWILFFIAALILVLFVLWAFLGTVSITVSGRGLIVSERGFTSVEAAQAGTVSRLHVKAGDQVQKGDLLIEMTDPDSKIASDFKGQILEVMVKPGDFIQEGSDLLWMELSSPDPKNKAVIYGYFPIHSAKRLSVNTPVVMNIPSVNRNKYGAIQGKVKSISLYAESKESLLNEVQNKALVDYLIADNPAVIKVIIEPYYQEGYFIWTSGLNPPEAASTGTVGTIDAVVEKVTPLYYLIPLSQLKTTAVRDDS